MASRRPFLLKPKQLQQPSQTRPLEVHCFLHRGWPQEDRLRLLKHTDLSATCPGHQLTSDWSTAALSCLRDGAHIASRLARKERAIL